MPACAADGSFLQRFLDATQKMSPAERGAYLEHPPPGAPDLDDAHHVRAYAISFCPAWDCANPEPANNCWKPCIR